VAGWRLLFAWHVASHVIHAMSAACARPCGRSPRANPLFLIDESGCYPLPSVTQTCAPVGQTPILREWWARDHLSTISAISPAGKLYFHAQEGAINPADVTALLEHLRREVSGRMVMIWACAPIHHRRAIRGCLANGAAQRLHLERLRAYAPELNPGKGLRQQLKGVERRHVGGCNIPHRRHT
jgi:transposase